MATPSKRGATTSSRPPVKPVPRTPAPSEKPFLRFYHSPALRKKTLAVLAALEKAPDPTDHRNALADVVVELTNSGLDYCFMRPLGLAKVGFLVQQSANLGLAGAQQVMGSVIRNIIGRMDRSQLLSVCASIREMML
jgi:hypothetical protein